MIDARLLDYGTDLLQARLGKEGFVRLSAGQCRAILNLDARDWAPFAASFGDLGQDSYMADGGRYRRRRHAAFRLERGRIMRKAHQPHYQSRDYNRLNGDVQRWFSPVEEHVAGGAVMRAVFALCGATFARDGGRHHVEMHQFRIETGAEIGRPTPEGLHRDGVNHVFVMLVERRNVREGVTRIGTADGAPLGEFMLAEPCDAVMLDDRRVLHGVTEIHAEKPDMPAWRDALVVTFKRD
ncbi:MAG: 2OG-Fe dioxygenase family protein [Sphingobium sp.]